MFSLTESKFQGWRAVAVAEDRTEHLVFVGRSSSQVKTGLKEAFYEILDEEERAAIKHISIQRWDGAPDQGRWVQQSTIAVPAPIKVERVLARTA
jgi:hypothetical protein